MEENKSRKGLFWAVFGVFVTVGIFLYSKISTATKLTYKIMTPESISFNFSNLKITWLQPVEITNPTNTGIWLRLIQFDVLLKGTNIGSGFLNESVVIQSLNKTILKVPCTIGVLDILTAIPDFIDQFSKRTVTFDLKGNINAEGFTIGVESSANLTIPNLSFLK